MRLFTLAFGLATATPAFATDISVPFSGTRPRLLDLHAGVQPYGFGAAIGARFGIPLVQNGFVDSIDNSVYINFGGDLYNTYSNALNRRGFAIGVPVAMQWNFNFTDEWSAFGEAGVNIFIGPAFFDGNTAGFVNGSWVITAVGGRYHLNESTALHLRAGWPYLSFGIELAL